MSNQGYDPLSYGQVRLGGASEAKDTPEELLFGAQPEAPKSGAADSSWDPPEQFVETATAAAAATAIPALQQVGSSMPKAQIAALRSDIQAAPFQVPAGPGANPNDSGVRKKVAAAATIPTPARTTQPIGLGAAPPSGVLAVAAPFCVLVALETIAVWLWLGQQNPVMAGLAAALGFGLAAMSWCALRR